MPLCACGPLAPLWAMPFLLPLLLLFSAAQALGRKVTGADSLCWHTSHFLVASGNECAAACAKMMQSRNGLGSIYPETYTTGTKLCCKCQYRSVPMSGAPSPNDDAVYAKLAAAPRLSSPAPAATNVTVHPKDAAKNAEKKPFKERVWWKVVLGCAILALIIMITAAALFWDCCKCRRSTQTKVADARQGYQDSKAAKKSKKGSSSSLSREAQRKLAALDLAREMRETKMEAGQAGGARFDVTAAAGSLSAPSSPGLASRSRLQKPSTGINPFV